ncbi:MAG: protein kinase [Candidatus Competibacter sp.]|nr:protein kinase [Candidatus Competibacter sp.]HRD50027.1 protein kinase [Candidatus Contendobacter sp.]
MQSGERIVINDRDYQIGPVLSTGAGSYGQVWAATDPSGRAVALKFINAEAMLQADPTLRGHWRAHLEREITFLKELNADQSRHIVTLFDHGLVDGQPVLVLERLQANLGQWLAQQRRENGPPPDLAQILDWADQILDGLDVVHGAGFVYRDLKFSNILVGAEGAQIKLADFGSLKREDGDNTRSFIGTPATMAPEQVLPACRGAEGCEYALDHRTDYYALGLLLFTLLTDRPTTAAQRRLGQSLALYGQEGAGQQREQLGGLDDEEREILRRSIEFWTMPTVATPGQGGAATPLADLVARLLARDPAARPADTLEIRAVLDAVRADQPSVLTLTPNWNMADPPAAPPNRRLHRNERRASRPRPRRQLALLAGILGLAGAMAWAIIRPGGEVRPDQTELNTVKTFASDSKAVRNEPVEPRSSTMKDPSTAKPVEESGRADGENTLANIAPPTPDAITQPAEPLRPMEPAAQPTANRPESASATATPEPSPQPEPLPESEPPTVVAVPPVAPAIVESPVPTRPQLHSKIKPGKPELTKPGKLVSPAIAAERPAVVEPAAVVNRPPTAPPPRIAKPAPKLPAPAGPKTVQVPAAPKIANRPLPRPKSAPVARANPVSNVAIRSSAAPRPVATKPDPVTRAALRSQPTPPALPPIELESRPHTAPTAPPPIELVSRSNTTVPVRAVPPTPPTPTPTRSADPIRQFQNDASRAASDIRRQTESFTRWLSRTGTTVSTEVQRGLETADRSVSQWTGHCNQADGCGRNVRVERRDRWSHRYGGGVVSQNHADENEESPDPPPRPPQAYR